jgi:hypothetical protein
MYMIGTHTNAYILSPRLSLSISLSLSLSHTHTHTVTRVKIRTKKKILNSKEHFSVIDNYHDVTICGFIFFPPYKPESPRSDGHLSEIGEWTDNHHQVLHWWTFKRMVFTSVYRVKIAFLKQITNSGIGVFPEFMELELLPQRSCVIWRPMMRSTYRCRNVWFNPNYWLDQIRPLV